MSLQDYIKEDRAGSSSYADVRLNDFAHSATMNSVSVVNVGGSSNGLRVADLGDRQISAEIKPFSPFTQTKQKLLTVAEIKKLQEQSFDEVLAKINFMIMSSIERNNWFFSYGEDLKVSKERLDSPAFKQILSQAGFNYTFNEFTLEIYFN